MPEVHLRSLVPSINHVITSRLGTAVTSTYVDVSFINGSVVKYNLFFLTLAGLSENFVGWNSM